MVETSCCGSMFCLCPAPAPAPPAPGCSCCGCCSEKRRGLNGLRGGNSASSSSSSSYVFGGGLGGMGGGDSAPPSPGCSCSGCRCAGSDLYCCKNSISDSQFKVISLDSLFKSLNLTATKSCPSNVPPFCAVTLSAHAPATFPAAVTANDEPYSGLAALYLLYIAFNFVCKALTSPYVYS